MSTHPKRAAIYVRVSTDKQEEEGTSLETQIEEALAYCAQKGYIIVPQLIFSESYTGMLYRERAVLSQVREEARQGNFDVLVVYALDRLSRVQAHQVILLEELEHLGVGFESVTEEFDNSLAGKILRSIMGIVAEVEHEKILERTERGRRKRATDGNMLGAGIAAYGYKWNEDRKRYLLNDKVIFVDGEGDEWTEVKVVVYIFDTIVRKGGTLRSIAAELTERHIPTRRGGAIWRTSTVSQIISSPHYIGKATAYKWDILDRSPGHMRLKEKPLEEQIQLPDGVIPPIIDEETFALAQERIEENKRNAVRNNKNVRDSLLRCGLVVCGHCGANMHVTRLKPNLRKHQKTIQIYYYCPNGRDSFGKLCQWNSISTVNFDEEVWSRAIPLLEDFALVAKKLEMVQGKDPAEKELPPIMSSLDEVTRKQKNNLAMLNGKRKLDEDTIDMIQEQLFKLGKEKAKLELERNAVLNLRVKWEEVKMQLEKFRLWCLKMAGSLNEATFEEKREALELLGVKARVWRRDHDPRYKIDFAPVHVVVPAAPQLNGHDAAQNHDVVSATSQLNGHNAVQNHDIVSTTSPCCRR